MCMNLPTALPKSVGKLTFTSMLTVHYQRQP
uniref:Uncharacterized protein n=1 Tax=Arundo donax TaxID=35708 RepID=A0A0A9HV36_ARUDO